MIINRIYETQNFLVAVACFLPGRTKDLSAPPIYIYIYMCIYIYSTNIRPIMIINRVYKTQNFLSL